MLTVHTVKELREHVRQARRQGATIGFVPTMGNLHAGHLSLIDKARAHCDFVVSSIFVNPMQFGANEDIDAYPRTLEADATHLESHQCDLLFAPSVPEMYPHGLQVETKVEVPNLGKLHCGSSRPGHFVGVATVVSKLFNLVLPDVAVFGQKDFQQLAIIRKMTQDLCFPIEIIGVPTARESNGLAMSSRNGYLSQEEKEHAGVLYQILGECEQALKDPDRSISDIRDQASVKIQESGFKLDYLNFAHPESLELATDQDNSVVILLAAFMGTTRLIDNIVVSRTPE